MVSAEKSYEYQRSYGYVNEPLRKKQKDVGPTPKRRVGHSVNKQETAALITAREKAVILMTVLLIGAICIGLVATMAYASKIKYNINTLQKKSNIIVGEIEDLNVKIQNGTNLSVIEQKATTELGMVFPDASQSVYMDGNVEPTGDFAVALKEKAYN